MKKLKILLPSDFTDVSNNAIKYALEMFGKEVFRNKVEFTLFHAYEHSAPLPSPSGVPVMTEAQLLELTKETLTKESWNWRLRYPAQTIKEHFSIGGLVHSIAEFVENKSIDMIVLGAMSKSGFERWLWGSNVSDIAQEADCPVLVVPEKATYLPLKKIVFATDFNNLEDLAILDPLRAMVKNLDPEFIMLHIYSENDTSYKEKKRMSRILDLYFNTKGFRHYFMENDDPSEGIENFIKYSHAGMLALVGQERGFFESLFHKSVTEQMIIHSEIPLLILNAEGREAQESDPSKVTESFKARMKSNFWAQQRRKHRKKLQKKQKMLIK